MEINDLLKIENETERVNALYDIFNEDTRLSRHKAAAVEFLTTIKYIYKYLKPGMKILDIGAGAGAYSIHFAKQGYCVNAIELADRNVEVFKQKITDELDICLLQGNALDLSPYESEAFDVVLMFGPLYHLEEENDRKRAIDEAKRVMKKDGTLFVSFINNDMIPFTEWVYNPDYLLQGDYDKETFKANDFPFVFFNLSQCREMLRERGLTILHEVASDGMSELIEDKINQLDEAGYAQYLKMHYHYCERPEHLGKTNHFLFVTKK